MKEQIIGKDKINKALIKLLLKMGFNPALTGFDYLIESVEYVFEHQADNWGYVKDLYPSVGKCYNIEGYNIERCIRSLIEVLWNNNHLEEITHALGLYKLYSTEKPSNSEMISLIAKHMSKHFIFINGKYIQLNPFNHQT